MPHLSRLLWTILALCLAANQPAHSRSFPYTPDVTESEQQRWGSVHTGYIADGCWYAPTAGLTVQVQPCRAFALETGDLPVLKGFSEPLRSVTFSGGDGRYWLGGRTSPGLAMPGWTCLDGVHYCWVKSDTPPAVPSGLTLLATSTVAAGAVVDSMIMAPWRRALPYTVPAGTTLTLGVCPAEGRRQLWQANGTSTGLIRFGPGACGEVSPEWWGADGTGRADATAGWQQAIDAVSGTGASNDTVERVPIRCEGSYKLLGTLTIRPRLNIRGTYKPSAPGTKTVSCEFRYQGTGNLFDGPVLPDSGIYHDMDFRHMLIVDTNATADKAFSIVHPVGLTMENIFIYGFNTPWYLIGQFYYGHLDGIHARMYRQRCLEISGPANFADVSVQCSASEPTVEYGVRVGVEPLWFSSSQNMKLRASVEAASGLPIYLAEQRALNAELYVEQPGACSAYSIAGAIFLNKIHGGRVHLSATGNCSGGPPQVPVGLYLKSSPELPTPVVRGVNNLIITGRLHVNYTVPVLIEKGPGMWGNNLTGLEFEQGPSVIGDFTTGVLYGGSYWTHGQVPIVDEGMGDTNTGAVWPVGTLIWNQGGANESANYFHQVTVAGNPPQVARLTLPAVNGLTIPKGTATPSVREGNTFHARLLLADEPTSPDPTPITNFSNAIGGLCADIVAVGKRTLEHGASLKLLGAADYAMTAGNTLRLCADSNLGPWRELSRCATCPP